MRGAISRTKNLHGTFRRLMKVGGFLLLLVRNPQPAFPMSTRKTSPGRSLCEHLQNLRDNGTIDALSDTIIKLTAPTTSFRSCVCPNLLSYVSACKS